MNKMKILLLGPIKAGKSHIANFLSDAIDQSAIFNYRPSKGVRILEYETDINLNSKNTRIEIELWDVSGDSKYETCWPVIAKDTNGIVFVYNQDQSDHDGELDSWFTNFVKRQRLKDGQCCVIAHRKPNTGDGDVVQLSPSFDRIRSIRSNLDESGDQFREDFSRYLTQLVKTVNESNDMEEQNIMNS